MFGFVRVVLVSFIFWNSWVWADSLPPENVLPGQKPQPAELPPESQLPGTPLADELPLADRTSPSDNPLPGEDQLPGVQLVQEPALPEDPPWLRLHLGGPTAPVQTVCFSRDSQRLLAAGNDKMVHAWIAAPRQEGEAQRWIYERPVRWQVQRATRGDIHSLVAMRGKFAFAGIGASALTGEIVIANDAHLAYERTLFHLAEGPRSQILSLAASEDAIFSLDSEGQLYSWSADPATGRWGFVTANTPRGALNEANHDLRPWRLRGSRIACTLERRCFFPVPVRMEQGIPHWRIATWKAGEAATSLLPDVTRTFPGGIGSLACDDRGERLAAADISDTGSLVFADLRAPQASQTVAAGGNVRDIGLTRDGTRVAALIAQSPTGPFQLRIWNWPRGRAPQTMATIALQALGTACAFSPNSEFLAVSQKQQVAVYEVSHIHQPPQVISTTLVVPRQVAFALEKDDRIVIRPVSAIESEETTAIVFDAGEGRYAAVTPAPAIVPTNPWQGTWQLTQQISATGTEIIYTVTREGAPYCRIPRTILGDSRITSACWLAQGENIAAPSHLLVGTAGRNHAYLLDITDPQKVSVVREYRGHSSPIRSVGVSADQRYAISGSEDGLVNVWKLSEAQPVGPLMNSWGAEFQIVNQQLVISQIIPDGPLYFRGARQGDVVGSVTVRAGTLPGQPVGVDNAPEKVFDNADEILQRLASTDGETMLRFELIRNGARQKPFYLHPAWQPLASLVTTTDRHWAFWTPYGYYDASLNGHRIFGWQINRGIDQAPDFFLAAEMKRQLERPRVLQRLLEAGSLPAAMEVAKTRVPFDLHDRLKALASFRPTVSIVAPLKDGPITEEEIMVEAVVQTPPGVEVLPPKVFANGVPAIELVDRQQERVNDLPGNRYHFRWRLALPPDPRIKLEVRAQTSTGITATDSLTLANQSQSRTTRPRIFLISAGISQYEDPQIPELDFAAANAEAVADALKRQAGDWEVETILLTDASVTQPLWNIAADSVWQRLRDSAQPQDVVLLFLSGHGIRDVESERYFYVTADSRFTDVAGRRYERCISAESFQQFFAGLACRKIAILDTCHSGAVQPLRQEDLKAMVRGWEDDLILTLTASEGDQEAFESREQQLGRFTARLVEGLEGHADRQGYGGNTDGVVGFAEVAQYVMSTVPQDASAAGQQQHPTLFPRELFPLIKIPLTTASQ